MKNQSQSQYDGVTLLERIRRLVGTTPLRYVPLGIAPLITISCEKDSTSIQEKNLTDLEARLKIREILNNKEYQFSENIEFDLINATDEKALVDFLIRRKKAQGYGVINYIDSLQLTQTEAKAKQNLTYFHIPYLYVGPCGESRLEEEVNNFVSKL